MKTDVEELCAVRDQALEGLKQLSEMCSEHLTLLDERDQAMRLMRPEGWPEGETLLSALRNVLQAGMFSAELKGIYEDMLASIAAEVGLSERWTRNTLLDAIQKLAHPTFTITSVTTITSGPPYEFMEWHYGARGVPWRCGGKILADFNALLVDGWQEVKYGGTFVLLRRSVNR